MIENDEFARCEASFTQRNIWILEQFERGGVQNNEVNAWKLKGNINQEVLKTACELIVEKNVLLRTTYSEENAVIYQNINPLNKFNIKLIDLSDLNDSDKLSKDFIESEAHLKFDLGKDLPIRVCFLVLAEQEYILITIAHRVAWDAQCAGLFIKELLKNYDYLSSSASSLANTKAYNSTDYSGMQKSFLDANNSNDKIQFWKKHLESADQVHGLILDKPRPALQSFDANSYTQNITELNFKNICKIAQQFESSVENVIRCLFAIILTRWSNNSSVVLGDRVNTRNFFGACGEIGNFSNSQIFCFNALEEMNFKEILGYAQSLYQNIEKIGYIPFEILIEKLHIERSLSHTPIFQIAFIYEELTSAPTFSQIECVQFDIDPASILFDLELIAINKGSSLCLKWVFAESLFRLDTIKRIAASFAVLIDNLIVNPAVPISKIPIITELDKYQLVEWSKTDVNFDEEKSVFGLFEQCAKMMPESIALRFYNEDMTYQDLYQKIVKMSATFIDWGISAEDKVAIFCEPSFDLVICIFALLKIQAIYIPLDPGYPSERISYMLAESDIKYVLTESKHLPQLNSENIKIICLDNSNFQVDASEKQKQFSPQSLANKATPYLLYTSGSTGTPKGVLGLEESLLNRYFWMKHEFPYDAQEIFCLKTSINSVDHLSEVFQPLLSGNPLVIIPNEYKLDLPKLIDLLHTESVHRITLVPSLLREVLEFADIDKLANVKVIICSGETLTWSLAEKCRIKLPHVKLINLYGSTESGADVTYYEMTDKRYAEISMYFEASSQSNYFNDVELGFKDVARSNKSLSEIIDLFRDTQLPVKALELHEYINHLKENVLPTIVDVSSQTYIGHMTSALPSFMPDFSKLISHLNQNVVKVETSKGITFLERQVLAMMHRLFFGMPQEFYDNTSQDPDHVFGVVTSGGSVSNLTSLWCARNKTLIEKGVTKEYLSAHGTHRVEMELGFSGGVIIGTRLMHYSMRKISSLIGIGENNIVHVQQRGNQKISIDDLESCIKEVHAQGKYIIAIVGIAGATETGTIDPLIDMAEVAEKYGIHFHVDAAWGGAVQFSTKYKNKIAGIDKADSITLCSHKQLYLPQGMSLCLFKSTQSAKSIAVHANYQAMKGSFDLGQYSLEGSRPANSLLLHASLHLLSKPGYARLIDQGMEKVQVFLKLLQVYDCFELVGLPELNIINYRYIPPTIQRRTQETYTLEQNKLIDDAVVYIQEKQFEKGNSFASKTKILHKDFSESPIWVFRVVISNPLTNTQDLLRVLQDQVEIGSNRFAGNDLYTNIISDVNLFEVDANDKFDHRAIPIGKPIHNTNIFILDGNHFPVPIGAVGEMYVGGKGLSQGYLNDEKLTRNKFVYLDIFPKVQQRLYKTGDLAKWLPDGNIEFLGRKDNQVKLRGFRIELAEIEHELNKIENIVDSVVVLQNRNQDNPILMAYVNFIGNVFDENYLRQLLKYSLPSYMVPVGFVPVKEIPLTPNGKIDRKRLEQIGEAALIQSRSSLVKPPQKEAEKRLCHLWSRVLDIAENAIDIDANFFELGGDSLLVIKIMALAKAENLSFTIRDFFHNQTIRSLAQVTNFTYKEMSGNIELAEVAD
jgi:putative pyridoxal-dependent aspartate 1-decarboxylase